MSFRFSGLSMERFSGLLALSDSALRARGILRLNAEPGYPCRVSLRDADPGESVLLLNYEHQSGPGPFRASGPIFVREAGEDAGLLPENEVPDVVRTRLVSVRAYDGDGMMVEADVTEGSRVEGLIETLFGHESVAYLHVHFARRGCYACRVERPS